MRFARGAWLGLTVLVLAGCTESTPPEPRTTAVTDARPNFVIILTDDQSAHTTQYMPALNAHLGAKGVVFNNAFVTTSLCCPSRASILTGKYAHNHRVLANSGITQGWYAAQTNNVEASTLAVWLQDTGYATGFFGKYLSFHPLDHKPAGWDIWREPETLYEVTKLSEDGVVTTIPAEYNTDLVSRLSTEWIRSAQQPFFAFVSFYAPHTPSTPAARHDGLHQSTPTPRPPNFNVPKGIGNLNDRSFSATRVQTWDAEYRDALESLQAVDDAITAIIGALARTGQLANTYIIFTSDNGLMEMQHALLSKNFHYESSLRVPMVIRGPGIRRGVRSQIALNTDIAPTILEAAGLPIPASIDGRSLMPVLTGRPRTWRRAFLVEHWMHHGVYQADGIRTGNALYAEWYTGEKEFYNMTTDPWQMNNLAESRGYAKYRDWLAAFRSCAGASCRALEDQ